MVASKNALPKRGAASIVFDLVDEIIPECIVWRWSYDCNLLTLPYRVHECDAPCMKADSTVWIAPR